MTVLHLTYDDIVKLIGSLPCGRDRWAVKNAAFRYTYSFNRRSGELLLIDFPEGRSVTREELLNAIPDFVDEKFPKNDTAASGGAATPGRGDAVVLLTQFVLAATGAESMPDAVWPMLIEQLGIYISASSLSFSAKSDVLNMLNQLRRSITRYPITNEMVDRAYSASQYLIGSEDEYREEIRRILTAALGGEVVPITPRRFVNFPLGGR